MQWIVRAAGAAVIAVLAGGLTGPAAAVGVLDAPAGDVAAATAPRPPADPGVGSVISRQLFSSRDGSIACRRVYTEMVWLECLLRATDEIVRFGPDESWIDVPCVAPDRSQTCRLGFGVVYLSRATPAKAARFEGARRIPLERLVQLGRPMMPYPTCIADPNLGLSCSTGMDDQVGQQIVLGLAGSIWSCPSYEYVPGELPLPRGHDLCRVVRP